MLGTWSADYYKLSTGRDSYLLWAGRSGDRIPVGVRFSAPVQTVSGAHPASYAMGIGSFSGVKRPGRAVDHLPLSSAEDKERVLRSVGLHGLFYGEH
jgi:hypothetical protein